MELNPEVDSHRYSQLTVAKGEKVINKMILVQHKLISQTNSSRVII